MGNCVSSMTNNELTLDLSKVITDKFPAQKHFILSKARYPVFTGGYGCSKTASGCIKALIKACDNPSSMGMVVAKTYHQLNDVVIREFFNGKWGGCPKQIIKDWNRTSKQLTLINDSKILFRSANDRSQIEGLVGPSLSFAWIDEASLIHKFVWSIMVGRLREIEDAQMWITTTPKGENWIYDIIGQEGVEHIEKVSTFDNPYTPNAYKDDLKKRYTGQFYDQNVLGKFVHFRDIVYSMFNETKHTFVDTAKIVELPYEVIYGVDWGYKHPAVIEVIINKGDTYYVVDETYESGIYIEDKDESKSIVHILKRYYEKYGRGRVYCDPSQPAYIETLKRNNIDALKGNNDVQPGIQRVMYLFNNNQLFIHQYKCRGLLSEIPLYHFKEGTESPVKEEDDAIDSIRYALHTIPRGSHETYITPVKKQKYRSWEDDEEEEDDSDDKHQRWTSNF